jgi:hypothetical protein
MNVRANERYRISKQYIPYMKSGACAEERSDA